MEQNRAFREVADIKRIMQDTRKRRSVSAPWGAAFLLIGAIAVVFLIPISAPAIAVALLVGGAVAYRRAADPVLKGISAAAMVLGGVILLAVAVALLGLVAYDGGVVESSPNSMPRSLSTPWIAEPIHPLD
ncbi:MAG: hypothetical protein WD333_11985 [Dehalococcoidia bacterium]